MKTLKIENISLGHFVFVILFTFSFFSFHFVSASDLKVQGTLDVSSGGYYSAVDGRFTINYTNYDLPWGSRVYLRYGFERGVFQNGKLQTASHWNDIGHIELTSSGPYKWEGAVSKQLYSRGSSSQLSALEFVVQVVLPDGHDFFDKGSNCTSGYYRAPSPTLSEACNRSICDLPTEAVCN